MLGCNKSSLDSTVALASMTTAGNSSQSSPTPCTESQSSRLVRWIIQSSICNEIKSFTASSSTTVARGFKKDYSNLQNTLICKLRKLDVSHTVSLYGSLDVWSLKKLFLSCALSFFSCCGIIRHQTSSYIFNYRCTSVVALFFALSLLVFRNFTGIPCVAYFMSREW